MATCCIVPMFKLQLCHNKRQSSSWSNVWPIYRILSRSIDVHPWSVYDSLVRLSWQYCVWKFVLCREYWWHANFRLWYSTTNCLRLSQSIIFSVLWRLWFCWVKKSRNRWLFDGLYYDYSWCFIYSSCISSMLWCEPRNFKCNSPGTVRVCALHRNIRRSI